MSPRVVPGEHLSGISREVAGDAHDRAELRDVLQPQVHGPVAAFGDAGHGPGLSVGNGAVVGIDVAHHVVRDQVLGSEAADRVHVLRVAPDAAVAVGHHDDQRRQRAAGHALIFQHLHVHAVDPVAGLARRAVQQVQDRIAARPVGRGVVPRRQVQIILLGPSTQGRTGEGQALAHEARLDGYHQPVAIPYKGPSMDRGRRDQRIRAQQDRLQGQPLQRRQPDQPQNHRQTTQDDEPARHAPSSHVCAMGVHLHHFLPDPSCLRSVDRCLYGQLTTGCIRTQTDGWWTNKSYSRTTAPLSCHRSSRPWSSMGVPTSSILLWQLMIRQRLRHGNRTVRMWRSHRPSCALGTATQTTPCYAAPGTSNEPGHPVQIPIVPLRGVESGLRVDAASTTPRDGCQKRTASQSRSPPGGRHWPTRPDC